MSSRRQFLTFKLGRRLHWKIGWLVAAQETGDEAELNRVHWHRGLLRARRERPSSRATEKCDELAPPFHSITSSA